MSSILNKLKKNSSNNLKTLSETINDDAKGSFKDDERYWKPEVDKANKGGAIIRFLPAVTEPTERVPVPETKPYAKIFTHGFKAKGGWYIENSRTTLGEADPVAEMNAELWNSGSKEKKDIAQKQNRKTNYIMNILVVKHAARPEDEGKVFLYKCPKTIFDKIKEKINPEDEGDEPENIFDLWTGRNFKLKIKDKGGYRNYDDSEWLTPGPVSDDDEEIERIYLEEYPLLPEIAPDKFKSYDELKKQLDRALGKKSSEVEEEESDVEVQPKRTTTKKISSVKKQEEDPPFDVDDEDDEEETTDTETEDDEDEDGSDEDFFAKLRSRKKAK
jgi:hypothetical protein